MKFFPFVTFRRVSRTICKLPPSRPAPGGGREWNELRNRPFRTRRRSYVDRHLSLSADGERRLRPSVRRGAARAGRAERRQFRVSARERHAEPRDRHGRAGAAGARQSAGRVFARIGAHTPRDRCRRGGECGARRRRRSAGHAGRRLGDRRREDGRLLPRQRRDRPGAARRAPQPGRRRRHDRAPAIEAALGAHDRDPDDAVGRRIHRVGRLHRHGAATSRRATAIR